MYEEVHSITIGKLPNSTSISVMDYAGPAGPNTPRSGGSSASGRSAASLPSLRLDHDNSSCTSLSEDHEEGGVCMCVWCVCVCVFVCVCVRV